MSFAASPRPIRSVLIANRGEIAVRVIETCRRLCLRTIAVYSDADAGAPHVRLADEAIRIGPAPARESYLEMDRVLAAARASEADAIHPGYGFLSENAEFARRCEAEKLIFIGPSAEAVARMGSKIEAKRIAEGAGVPTVPGYHGSDQDEATLAAEAERIGFPVLIKASAGGGGRGMRRVERLADLPAALSEAKDEASAAFGDASVLIEKLIENPRHLEVQLAGDRLGNLVHLFERDCSVQRNNQKLLEEAPAPNLPEVVREALHEAALTLGRAIGYDSAGTVEFIMEAGGTQPYFLEMNTRLQVEHPVTELVTGIDLVEWQIRAAAGEPLPLTQDRIGCRGHAIEARITAERADRDFQPAHGVLSVVAAPAGIRFDAGIAAGSQVGLHYDSLLAKAIAWGRTRESALERLRNGLQDLHLLGVPTIQPFLVDAVRHPLFEGGQATTRFVGTAFPDGWRPAAGDIRLLRACAAAAWLGIGEPIGPASWSSPWLKRGATRVMASERPARVELAMADEYGAQDLVVSVGRNRIAVSIAGETVDLGEVAVGEELEIRKGTAAAERLGLWRSGETVHIGRRGLSLSARVGLKVDAPRYADEATGSGGGSHVRAPLPGLISRIDVSPGEIVEKGARLLQMEAMKLVHTLTAPVGGRVAAVHFAAGDTVSADAVLIDLSPEEREA